MHYSAELVRDPTAVSRSRRELERVCQSYIRSRSVRFVGAEEDDGQTEDGVGSKIQNRRIGKEKRRNQNMKCISQKQLNVKVI